MNEPIEQGTAAIAEHHGRIAAVKPDGNIVYIE